MCWAAHAGDKWYASVLPEAVVFPESTEDVSLLLRYASSMNIPVTARGGGVGYVGDAFPCAEASAFPWNG